MNVKSRETTDQESSFWSHVEEFRRTLIQIFVIVAAGTTLALYFYQDIYKILSSPIPKQETVSNDSLDWSSLSIVQIQNRSNEPQSLNAPQGAILVGNYKDNQIPLKMGPGEVITLAVPKEPQQLVILGPIDGVLVTLKVAFWVGLAITSPLWLLVVIRFVLPGLQGREKDLIPAFVLLTLTALAAGIFFGMTVTIPIANEYLFALNRSIGTNMWTVSEYLSYTVMLLTASALAFEFAVILFLLVHLDRISSSFMDNYRKVTIVAIFIIAALITPPDVPSQLAVAIPMTLAFEGARLYARWREGRSKLDKISQITES